MRAFLLFLRFALLGSLIAGTAKAQLLVPVADIPAAAQVFSTAPSKSSLPCQIELDKKSRLDFTFRYTTGFLIECRLGLLAPDKPLYALLRVTPQGGQPVFMVEKFNIPKMRSEQFTRFYSVPVTKMTAQMTGGFATGPGEYLTEIVLTDKNGHTCRKSRKLRAGGDQAAGASPVALGSGVVTPSLINNLWNGVLTHDGTSLTIFLHAYTPGDNVGLYALERTYLLQSLDALLDQVPCRSVRLIAFNLDHQQEVFRTSSFGTNDFAELEKALQQAEPGTIQYQALKPGAWAKFLVDMTQTEANSDPAPDAIVFLGPWGSHEYDRLPLYTPEQFARSNTHVFYFQFFPPVTSAHGKDGLERLIDVLHGSTFVVWSPEMLAQAIKKMTAQMRALALH